MPPTRRRGAAQRTRVSSRESDLFRSFPAAASSGAPRHPRDRQGSIRGICRSRRRSSAKRQRQRHGYTSTGGVMCPPSAGRTSVAECLRRSWRLRLAQLVERHVEHLIRRFTAQVTRLRERHPFRTEVRQSGLVIGLRVDQLDGAVYLQQELYDRGVGDCVGLRSIGAPVQTRAPHGRRARGHGARAPLEPARPGQDHRPSRPQQAPSDQCRREMTTAPDSTLEDTAAAGVTLRPRGTDSPFLRPPGESATYRN